MSYLGFPRITFAGRFQTDPSTINNDAAHYDSDRFLARYQQRGAGTQNGWWNPRGTGSWRIRGCTVRSVVSASGRPATDPATGAAIAQADDRVSAKLVDLDPLQQMVSAVFGLRLALRLADGTQVFSGDFAPAPFCDIWQRHATGPGGMRDLAAVYESVIEVDDWRDSPSVLLGKLREATAEDKLSIRFVVDGYQPDATAADFTWGRIVGAIGPYLAGEPQHFPAVRILTGNNGPARCRIDEATRTLSLDLGNSLPTAVAGGSVADAGVLRLVAQPHGGDPVVLMTTGSGTPYYDSVNEKLAGILDVELTPEQVEAAAKSQLVLLDSTGVPMLSEDPSGRYLRADQFVFRMSPGDKATARLHATTFGQPAEGVEVTAKLAPPQPGPPPLGTPESALTFPGSVTTGPDGWATLELAAADPGNPRGYLDGQVYTVDYGWRGAPRVGGQLSTLVWNAYEAPPEPTWVADVQPILQQYANLYPIMRDVVDLGDYADVAVHHWRALDLAMGLPTTDPNYMPVTRDLSPAKRDMILGWLRRQPNPPVFRIDDVASLRQVLQIALELEHATIPPYLYALFSIVPGRNQEVAELIKSVVMQEMLHMALVCNLLNAVGGEPRISAPAFVPKYPGHLPGGVRPDLTVSLRACSKQQVKDVFMAIEQPSEPVDVPDDVPAYVDMRGVDVDPAGMVLDESRAQEAADQLALHHTRVEHEPLTIGWFYQQIGKAIVELGDAIFTGDPSLQMTPEIYTGAPGTLYVIQNTRDALLALQEIERQGEGTPGTDPTDGGTGELAHYYRFQEIVEGRHMIETSPGQWAFDGPEIPFDPAGVLPAVDDPDTGSLPAGSAVRSAAEVCDRVYGNLLRSLHQTFNGSPEKLGPAVGLMFSLEVQARELMTMPIAPPSPTTAGPSFQPL